MSVRGMFRPGMRAYIVPLVAGLGLALSPFLPWVWVGDVSLPGVPDTTAMWVVAQQRDRLAVVASLSRAASSKSRSRRCRSSP